MAKAIKIELPLRDALEYVIIGIKMAQDLVDEFDVKEKAQQETKAIELRKKYML